MRPFVVLFDLDGTVLTFDGSSPGPGRTALDRAMHELHGIERATEGLRLAGGTDRAFARVMLRKAGAPEDEPSIERVLDAYVEHLKSELVTRRYRPIGDVDVAVSALQRRGAVVGVGTGNVRAGARLKLESAGLDALFDLHRGGYGCDAEPRADILRLAVERCRAGAGWSVGEAEVVVVGDTEHDVRAARAIGAKVVGLAVSAREHAELAAAGADVIVDACGERLVDAVFQEADRRDHDH